VPVEDFRMGARSVSEDSGYSRRPDFATWRRSSRPIGWPGEPSSRWRTAGPDLQQAFPNRIGLRPGRSITVGRGEPDFRSVGMPRGLGLKTWEARVWAAPLGIELSRAPRMRLFTPRKA
jgi:hypothetical protein